MILLSILQSFPLLNNQYLLLYDAFQLVLRNVQLLHHLITPILLHEYAMNNHNHHPKEDHFHQTSLVLYWGGIILFYIILIHHPHPLIL